MARRKNSRHGSYPGDIGKIPKTKAAFRKEYYGLLTKYFSTKHYKGGGAWELPTAESRRIGARLAELYDAHPRWADQIDEEWGADQRRNPRRKKSNPRNRKLDIKLPNTNLTVVGVGRDTNGNSVIRLKTPNQRAFSIQTVGKPIIHRVKQGLMAGNFDDSIALSQTFIREVVKYIKAHGSAAQKKSLRTYGRMALANPKRRKNGDRNAPQGS